MADVDTFWEELKSIMRAGRHALDTATGVAPQNLVGGVQYAKNLVTHPIDTAKSTHLDENGNVVYTSPGLDSPAAAMGNFIQTAPSVASDPDVLKHETRHAAQSDVLGPAYLPMAVAEALGKYGAGPLERDAMLTTTPNAEMFRPGSSMEVKPAFGEESMRALIDALIRGK